MRSSSRAAAAAGVISLGLALLGLATPGAIAAPGTPRVNWGPCFQWLSQELEPAVGQSIRYECAKVPVPLDHDSPRGAKVLLSLIRIPASDQAHRIGSVFINPGGPGLSGVDIAAFL